jgi:DNA-binding transcriptional LysR family regulator
MQIKQLEAELQVKLFDRVGKTIAITNEGKRFIKYADDIIAASNNAIADLTSELKPTGILRIGILESVCSAYLPEILNSYHAQYPQVSTIINIGTFDELALLLNSNSIDLLWTFDKPIDIPEWKKAFYYTSFIDVVCSNNHKLASAKKVRLSELADETFIFTEKICSYRRIFEDNLLYLGYQPRIFLEIGNTDIIKKFVEADLGITILPHFTIQEELAANKLSIIDISDYQLQMQGQVFYHKSKWLSPALQAFLDIVTQSAFI